MMSKDIRSYFTVSPKTAPKATTNGQQKVNKFGQRKRQAIIIDSDSDDESSPVNVKRSKTLDKKSPVAKTDSKVTSKYFQSEQVKVSDVFGSRPVKRDNSRNIIKKVVTKEILEFHIDDDFESELARLDEVEQTKTVAAVSPEGDDILIDEVKTNNKRPEFKKDRVNGSSDLFDSVDIPRKKIKLEDNITSSHTKNKLPDSKAKKGTSPSQKNKSPKHVNRSNSELKKSPSKTPSSSPKSSPSKSFPLKSSPPKISSPKSSPSKSSPPKSSPPKSSPPKSSPPGKKLFPELSPKVSRQGSTASRSKDVSYKDSRVRNNSPPTTETTFKNEAIQKSSSSPCNLWVEKYKPSTTKQIIGQQGEKSCVHKLTTWLKNWHKNNSGNKKLAKPSPWAKNDDGGYFKAALLSGPPGVGKTTTAHLVSKELGFDVVEFNASDTRSKKLLHQEISELLSTNSLSPFFTGKGDQVTKQHVLLMDEVDGMAGNEDRGGVQELIQLIKSTRIPVICMCNDRNHPKIRSLANYCFDLRFSKPRAEQIKGAMMSVCFKEKLKISPTDITEIITSANQDIRLIINHLSMLSIENTSLANSSKHVKMGPWDITRKIFSEEEHKSMSINDKCDLFFHDYNATPLFVQENYLNAVPHKPEGKNKVKKMELFAKAARSLSLGDLTEKSIRSHNAWGLLPVQAIFSSLVPGDVLEGHIGAQINFPAWFGKNSRQTKLSRLLQELTVHTRLKISGNKEAMNLDYLLPLERSILMPLVSQGTEGIPESLAVLNEYCLVREDLESFTELSSWPNSKNLFAEVESKVKAAFTRAYNKTSVPTPYAAVPIKKATRSDIDSMDIEEEEEGGTQGVEEEDEEEEGLEVDSMIMIKKKPANKKADKDIPSTSKGNKNVKRGRKK